MTLSLFALRDRGHGDTYQHPLTRQLPSVISRANIVRRGKEFGPWSFLLFGNQSTLASRDEVLGQMPVCFCPPAEYVRAAML